MAGSLGPKLRRVEAAARAPWFGRLAALVAGLCLGAAAWFAAEPVSYRLADAAQSMRDWVAELRGEPARPKRRTEESASVVTGLSESQGSGEPGATLPDRVSLQQSGGLELMVRIDDPAQRYPVLSRPLYLRSFALAVWDGRRWSFPLEDATLAADADDGTRDGRIELRPEPPEAIAHTVFLPANSAASLPAIQGVCAYDLPALFLLGEDRFAIDAPGKVRYSATSAPRSLDDLRSAAPGDPGETYRRVPADATVARMWEEIARPIRLSGASQLAQLKAIRAELRARCEYSLTIENKNNLPPLENFLFGERRGYCDFYATSAALLARLIGFPTRVAYGYAGGEADPAQGIAMFRGTDAHSWAEVFVAGQGWVIFEATPPGEGGADRPQTGAAASPDFSEFANLSDGALDYSERRRAWFASLGEWAKPALFAAASLALILLAKLVFAVGKRGGTPAGGLPAGGRAEAPDSPYAAELRALARRLGIAQPPGRTLREVAAAIEAKLGDEASGIGAIVAYHYETRFAGSHADPQRERRLASLARSL
ncbi:MAG: transglutaminase domain-containing protein [Verrucomicrobiales bacterium]